MRFLSTTLSIISLTLGLASAAPALAGGIGPCVGPVLGAGVYGNTCTSLAEHAAKLDQFAAVVARNAPVSGDYCKGSDGAKVKLLQAALACARADVMFFTYLGLAQTYDSEHPDTASGRRLRELENQAHYDFSLTHSMQLERFIKLLEKACIPK